jgi:hypothetical protein
LLPLTLLPFFFSSNKWSPDFLVLLDKNKNRTHQTCTKPLNNNSSSKKNVNTHTPWHMEGTNFKDIAELWALLQPSLDQIISAEESGDASQRLPTQTYSQLYS